MIIISRKALSRFSANQPRSADALLEWWRKANEADWSCMADVKETFNSVDYVGNDLYVFDIAGNRYRLVARIIFRARTVYIRWVGTHVEYDRLVMKSL